MNAYSEIRPLLEVLLPVVTLLIGLWGGHWLTLRRDRRKREEARQALATALLGEIWFFSFLVARAANRWNGRKMKLVPRPEFEHLKLERPPEATIFGGNSATLGLLRADEVIAVTKFYLQLSPLRELTDGGPPEGGYWPLYEQAAARAWGEAAKCAAEAIQVLLPVAGDVSLMAETDTIKSHVEDLRDLFAGTYSQRKYESY